MQVLYIYFVLYLLFYYQRDTFLPKFGEKNVPLSKRINRSYMQVLYIYFVLYLLFYYRILRISGRGYYYFARQKIPKNLL